MLAAFEIARPRVLRGAWVTDMTHTIKGIFRMYELMERIVGVRRDDRGSISIEYAVTMIVGVILAGILIAAVSSDTVRQAMTGMVLRNLQ